MAIGAIKGRIQAISSRNRLRFILYDTLFDKPIPCFIEENQKEMVVQYWDKLVFVSGEIIRNPATGVPIRMEHITDIELVPASEPGSYKNARGILAGLWDEPSEVLIRRLRDGEDGED